MPRRWYWKFFFRWTIVVGAAGVGLGLEGSMGEVEEGATVVMDVRRRVGPPHEGQNFLVGSLQSLRKGARMEEQG